MGIQVCNAASFVIGPSPILEAMYRANVSALDPFHDEPYDADKYNEKMLNVHASDYSGFGCEITISETDKTWATAKCFNGILDVRNCLVLADDCVSPALVQVERVPFSVLEREGRFFYVCGSCGKIYWDGCHIVNYSNFAESLFDTRVNEGENETRVLS
ncbi:unnamed protein product [Anisakis simplex]|uniref:Mut7-C RNAse domain-containing protein n=1 Tax=Anisakis simplex TaxID=6269 RepID=A0A3P6NAT2_ANISI|nr:unnamed protein product [Anisakis simplex]